MKPAGLNVVLDAGGLDRGDLAGCLRPGRPGARPAGRDALGVYPQDHGDKLAEIARFQAPVLGDEFRFADEVPLPAGFVAGVATIIFSRSVRSAPVFSSSKYLRTISEMLSILTVALGMGFIRVNLRPPLQTSPTK
jgi:hypothetical protein